MEDEESSRISSIPDKEVNLKMKFCDFLSKWDLDQSSW